MSLWDFEDENLKEFFLQTIESAESGIQNVTLSVAAVQL